MLHSTYLDSTEAIQMQIKSNQIKPNQTKSNHSLRHARTQYDALQDGSAQYTRPSFYRSSSLCLEQTNSTARAGAPAQVHERAGAKESTILAT
jgi:hypothetical protein